MAKVAIVVFSDTETPEALGKLLNAFLLAEESVANGDDLKIIFDGAGTKWIGELEKENHKLNSLYLTLKNNITGACKYCSEAFGVKSQVEKAGVEFIDEYKDHPSLRNLITEGYTVLIF
jgi:hypothetical protein